MQTLEVGCAVIEKDGKILIAQRSPGDSYAGYWEFPGGTRQPEETMEECLIREIQEELGMVIRPRSYLFRCDHSYPERNVELYFYHCDWLRGRPVALECFAFCWVEPKHLSRFMFVPGDEVVVAEIFRKKAYYFNRSGS